MADEPRYVEHAFDGDVHILRIANAPVNTLRTEVRAGLLQGLQAAAKQGARAIVLIGTGRGFSAGAEMTEFGKPRKPPSLNEVFDAIENSRAPVVAAIHGNALGGGLELALACHARVAAPGAQLGLPEVKRGFVPGAGGTQRLPRLIGLEALRLIVSGDPVGPEEALKLGFIDAVLPGDLERAAVAWARQHAGDKFTLARHRTDKIAGYDAAAFDEAAKKLTARSRGQESPKGCVTAVRAAFTMPFDEGLNVEREQFQTLVAGEQSQALRHIFFGEREAVRIPDLPADAKPLPVNKLVVIGGGTMGGGIAMSAANFGLPVTIVETSEEALQKGLKRCEANWERTVKSGRLSQAEYEKRRANLTGTTDFDKAVGEADLVIEAVFENMEVKKEVFARLDKAARPGVVLASNTSTLSIDEIASATRRPELVIGMHFFSPANVMRLLENVKGAKTSPVAIATATEVGKRIGKLPVLVGNCDGFVGNRMTGKRGPQIEKLLLEGCLPQDIDRVMESYGMAMGPLATGDLAGLDIGAAVRKARGTVAPVADAVVAAGRLGQKTGKGYYDYDENRKRMPSKEVEQIILDLAEKMQVRRRKIEDQEILERVLLPMVNEGARILEEGIAYRPIDIDVIFINGFGWPAFRGGPMFFADRLGLKAVRDKLAHYAEATGDANLKPAALIEKLAAEGGSFATLKSAPKAA
ncbi:3-hydroxyacyl-CoA dehydrogenase NAD-binding domain-containing protein [Siccirubricoccus sp. KC 17139]|uniref:3-hydroxyacyl-CoA dehydrogenase NAD-binding domain-containing protein n=1 Tax=Siccirubricoccus soli TaxID=2899147 RepID=A0ABT1D1H7_9PROT|nr:3-hydroxyacyl-CoA dehydrogenase NAD-binding domain-containing protein [Siccirubricoccus soli]MCO6415756.1 3-hydroxyacyl-CoA dehydrogenase NAD-binding domain-containing protein [Siccirubricoccus soli]MCP2681888.1 3-hydroxyacyl-CoA dehydrogenase NAD-binding domain-containing protein [Siccirubricoccus soli]